jgi:NTP pyrophosphatase (non-canonical NTP hydrolase)
MKINVTEQTSTFPVPLNKLKGRLMDNLDLSWETEHGKLHISLQTIDWIIKNAKTSMFNNERCYVYNKAFARFYDNNDLFKTNTQDNLEIFDKIRSWAKDRGLYEKGDPMTQYVKLQEEAGELAKALLKNDQPEVIDAIGDIVVVLTNLAHQKGLTIEECIATAYEVINKRTGKMINGTFVKDEK